MSDAIAVRFPGAQGAHLSGRLERPLGQPPRAYALFAHCFTCGKDLRAAREISRALTEEGFGVLRFDFTGLGESAGDFADTDFAGNVADLVAAARWLETEHTAPSLLIGHSLGGAAAIVAATELPSVQAVATIGAPSTTEHLADSLKAQAPALEQEASAEVAIAGRAFRIGKKLVDDLAADRVRDAAKALRRPFLVLHAPGDEIVGIDHARRLFEAARHPKSFQSLDHANHLLSRGADARQAARLIATWAAPYLPEAPAEDETPAGLAPGLVRVEGGAEGFTLAVLTGKHRLIADEPAAYGGEDRGPAPFEFLLAGLGACTAMTLRMYADRKGWPLEGVHVDLQRTKGEGEAPDHYRRLLQLAGPLDDEQRQRLTEIAERCPVHRSLERGAEITTELAPR